MTTVYDIVMNDRKQLVNTLIKHMKKGYVWTKEAWSSAALLPYNPASGCRYLGGNRARLMLAAIENNYNDPRWCTYRQAQEHGWNVRKGAKSVLLEKWIFTETKTIENEFGEPQKITVDLETPKVNYFRVFNAEQIHGIPALEAAPAPDYDAVTDTVLQSSKCPVVSTTTDKACYIPNRDIIRLPPRFAFKSAEAYLSVLIHEMCHSTGHPDRLNRSLQNSFGSQNYAREELRAELGSAFFKANLQLPLSNEQLDDHSNYLLSWISVLKKDPNEFFRACRDAEKISDYLQKNYDHTIEIQKNLIKDVDYEYKEILEKLEQSIEYVNSLKEEMLQFTPDDADYYALEYELVKSAEVEHTNAQNAMAQFLEEHPEFQDKYMDSISRQFQENNFPLTDSLKNNLSELFKVTGRSFSLQDLASRTCDFGKGQEFADKIFSECQSIELALTQSHTEILEMEAMP